MRCGFRRDHSSVKSGLYSIGSPSEQSPVLVTANYKMTFDTLRSHLKGVDAWILVLETRGVNVWCAAGKGTFGTEELVRQMERCNLASVVSHKNIIVPQLGGPGVAAHEVKRQTGFQVHYGPIRAKDIRQYLHNGMKTTPEMRRFEFPFWDRVVLSPMEFTIMLKWFFLLSLFLLLVSGFHQAGYSLERILGVGLPAVGILFGCWVGAAFLIPALLPWLPGRMLAVKGFGVGLLLGGLLTLGCWLVSLPFDNGAGMGGVGLLIVALSGYFGLMLTGSMPYTSLSGVKKEMRITIPVMIVIFIAGIVLWSVGRFV